MSIQQHKYIRIKSHIAKLGCPYENYFQLKQPNLMKGSKKSSLGLKLRKQFLGKMQTCLPKHHFKKVHKVNTSILRFSINDLV